jgi:predicted N-acetyltransferase YhbS
MTANQPDLHILEGFAKQQARIIALFGDVFTAAEGPEEGQAIAALVAAMAALCPDAGLRPFTAWQGNRPVGAVIFSPLRDAQAAYRIMLLSPMAVATDQQAKGIGQALIRHALDRLAKDGAQIAVTYGDPAFYGRTGFANVTTDTLPAPHPLSQPMGWIAQSLTGAGLPKIQGPLSCVAPLDDPAFW